MSVTSMGSGRSFDEVGGGVGNCSRALRVLTGRRNSTSFMDSYHTFCLIGACGGDGGMPSKVRHDP